ncbi:MAG: helix-turn-helix domain-containing protein [Pseudodesulfovibrio sp.]|nr:helix-turn-helix domain-containing protein [Pseudodesulfovibrio sp.]
MPDQEVQHIGLAADSGVSQRTIQKARDYRIESCTLRTLSKIAEVLDWPVKDLFKEKRTIQKRGKKSD